MLCGTVSIYIYIYWYIYIYTSFTLFESERVTKSQNLECFCQETEYNEILANVIEDSGSLECTVCCVICVMTQWPDTLLGNNKLQRTKLNLYSRTSWLVKVMSMVTLLICHVFFCTIFLKLNVILSCTTTA